MQQTQDQQRPETQALAILQRGGPLQQLAEFQRERFNILAPIDWNGRVPPGTRLSLRVEAIDIQADTYAEGNRRALFGHALDRLSAAAGVTTVESVRVDGRTHPHLVEFLVLLRIIDCDGVERYGRGTRAIDLRQDIGDGTPGADLQEILYSAAHAADKGGRSAPRIPEKQIIKARQFIVPMCESKARNRAIRHLINVKAGYLPAELQKPFVVAKLVVDTTDPMAREMVLGRLTGAQTVYPPRALPAESAEFSEPPPDVPPAGDAGGRRSGASPASGPPPPAPPPASPPEQRLHRIYDRFVVAGGTDVQFRGLVEASTGLVRTAGITHEQVNRIESAIDHPQGAS